MVTVKRNYSQDEHGQWWIAFKHGRRTRATVRACGSCGRNFPGWRAEVFCSQACAASVRQKQCVAQCPWCRAEFELKESQQRFCSHSCAASYRHAQAEVTTPDNVVPKNAHNPRYYRDERGQWWYQPRGTRPRSRAHLATCAECQVVFLRSVFHKSTWCSASCATLSYHRDNPQISAGPRSPHWKGGKIKRRGYVMAYAPDHPSVSNKARRYVLEHRLVMEQKIGRLLLPTEHVHHKNGIKDDNRINNLELWAKAHPPGQRAKDTTPEQSARDLLERMGVADAQSFSSGELIELANLIAKKGKSRND